MVADGQYLAVLDRFEDEQAVLLVEDDGEVAAERVIPTRRLPEDARRQDAVLSVSVRDGLVASIEYDPEATDRRTAEAQSRFDRLAKRPEDDSSDSDGEESTGNTDGSTGGIERSDDADDGRP